MSRVPETRTQIEAAEAFRSYVKGWKCGSARQVHDRLFSHHAKDHIQGAYNRGHADGVAAAIKAANEAADFFGYDLEGSILR